MDDYLQSAGLWRVCIPLSIILHEAEKFCLHITGSTCKWLRNAKNRLAAGLRVAIS